MSFIEVLVVLAILAFVSAAMMPNTRTSPRIESAVYAAGISAELRAVRAKAINFNQDSAFRLDVQRRVIVSDVNSQERPLPVGLDASLLAAREYVRAASDAAIVFFPDGSSTGGTLTLKSGRTTATIRVDWLTGRIDVERDAS